ncbi:MAG: IMP dehydrogenase [Patescibacteria group bacterium]
MNKDIPLGLSFDDVLIVPGYSKVVTRKLIDLKTNFSKNIRLNIPVVSANMDTVTESPMAIAMAREGGIGIIHRFMPLEKQINEVHKVKRSEALVISDPVTVSPNIGLAELRHILAIHEISSVLVTDKENILKGIVTARDIRFCNGGSLKVSDIMTPRAKLVTADPNIKKEEAISILEKYKIEKIPLVDKKGVVQGLITAADFTKTSKHTRAAKDRRGRLLVGAAIGVNDGEDRAAKLVKVGVDALVVDIAHGHHRGVIRLIKALKKKYENVDIIAGNVATAAGVEDLAKAGADAVKVGIGPGRACSTRIVAGAGVPQFSAVKECVRVGKRLGVPVIADGGIKNSGDLAKIIGAGASTAMIGSLFSGTKESPGEYFIEDGVAFKIYRGLASLDASLDRSLLEADTARRERAAEGISTRVAYRGDVAVIIKMLIDGLQSGMSYSGASDIQQFWHKVKFVRITEAGMRESRPRP